LNKQYTVREAFKTQFSLIETKTNLIDILIYNFRNNAESKLLNY